MGRKELKDYVIVDCHSHLYTTREIGLRASSFVGMADFAGGYDGTVEDALNSMRRDNVSLMIMMNYTPTAIMKDVALERLAVDLPDYSKAEREIDKMLIERLRHRNEWTCEVGRKHPNLIPFICVDAMMNAREIQDEIADKVKNHGAKGLKFQHHANRWLPHDRRLWPAFEIMQELDLPIMCHSGLAEGFPSSRTWTEPKYFADVLSDFPKLRLVLAHLGIGFWEQTKYLAKKFPNVCFDCNCAFRPFPDKHALDDAAFIALIREVGVERVVFGSEYPMMAIYRPAVLQHIVEMNLTEEEKRMILGENAMRIYKLSQDLIQGDCLAHQEEVR